ncbi:MAG TPA: hypothetical protein VF268_16675 [Gammaproteobacteria bacterium]
MPTGPGFEAFYNRINAASGAVEFQELAAEILSAAPREHIAALLELLLARWAEQDLTATLNFAAGIQDAGLRETLLRHTLIRGGEIDFPATLDWLTRFAMDKEKKYNLIAALYEGVAKESPERALRFVDLLAEDEFKDHIVRVLLEQWAEQDLMAAFAWANEQGPSQALDNALASLLFRLVDQDHPDAGVLIRNMRASEQKDALARKYADKLAATDIQMAASWARTLDDPNSYGVALSTVYESWFRSEPDKKIIMEQVLVESDNDLRDRLINEIALDMANSDPAELAEMVHRLPESAQLDVAEKAVRFWKERNQSAALDWVEGLSAGPVKDRVSAVMVEDLMTKGNRDRALLFAGTIGDQSLRYQAAKKVLEYWYQVNPDEAQRVVYGVPYLSEAEKQSISSLIQ